MDTVAQKLHNLDLKDEAYKPSEIGFIRFGFPVDSLVKTEDSSGKTVYRFYTPIEETLIYKSGQKPKTYLDTPKYLTSIYSNRECIKKFVNLAMDLRNLEGEKIILVIISGHRRLYSIEFDYYNILSRVHEDIANEFVEVMKEYEWNKLFIRTTANGLFNIKGINVRYDDFRRFVISREGTDERCIFTR